MQRSHVNIREDRLKSVIKEKKLRKEVSLAYAAQDGVREFSVTVTTSEDRHHHSYFTAAAIVQLTNQPWVKSVTEWCDMSMAMG